MNFGLDCMHTMHKLFETQKNIFEMDYKIKCKK